MKAAIAEDQPAISVDTKKKELVGDFRDHQELRRQQDPEPVRVHDFKLPELGKVAPYGVYDIAASSAGSVSELMLMLPPSRWNASVAGGRSWDGRATRTRTA